MAPRRARGRGRGGGGVHSPSLHCAITDSFVTQSARQESDVSSVPTPGVFRPDEYDPNHQSHPFTLATGPPFPLPNTVGPSLYQEPQAQYDPRNYQHSAPSQSAAPTFDGPYEPTLQSGFMPFSTPSFPQQFEPQLSLSPYSQEELNTYPPLQTSHMQYPRDDSYFAPPSQPQPYPPYMSYPGSQSQQPYPQRYSSELDMAGMGLLQHEEDDDDAQDGHGAMSGAQMPVLHTDGSGRNQALASALVARTSSTGSSQGPTAAASVPQDLLMQAITPTLISRWSDPLITTSASTNVLEKHIARRGPPARKAPYPPIRSLSSKGTSHTSTSRTTAFSSFGSTSLPAGSAHSSSQQGGSSAAGLAERTVKQRHRDPSGPKRPNSQRPEPLSDNDKLTLKYAVDKFISTMCQFNCWPTQGAVKTDMVTEAGTQANAAAVREKRAPSVEDKFYYADVSINDFIIILPC